ncbi:hypothetical protein [Dactylosporangium sp. CA-092794]|uniref:hypothetical protein n=1 Tax=Dactylosporangium sp. CA-092794 TaxID=3239929 RepID=UPI003D8C7447
MDRVLTGDVLRGPDVVLPKPTKRRRRWPWIIAIIATAVACCLAVPVAVIAVPLIRDTIAAGHGSNAPQEALLKFMYTMQPPADAKRGQAEPLIVRNHRTELLQQRADYLGAIDATNHAHPDLAAKLALGDDPNPQDAVTIHGDDATVTQYWRAEFDFAQPQIGGALGYTSQSLPWTATAHHDRDGWRLVTITMPPWCGTLHDDGTTTGYAKCD